MAEGVLGVMGEKGNGVTGVTGVIVLLMQIEFCWLLWCLRKDFINLFLMFSNRGLRTWFK